MIRAAAGLAALAALAAPAFAEGGRILSGEHDSFSRIVLPLEATTEWSLETAGGRTTIFIPGKRLDFGTAGVFEKMPQTRIRAVRAAAGDAGTSIEVELGCDCRVSTTFVHGRWLALDVGDRAAGPPTAHDAAALPAGPDPAFGPPPEDPETRAVREATAVSSAEQILIQQIERAASQGLIQLRQGPPAADDEAGLREVAVPEAPAVPKMSALPTLPSREGERPAPREDSLEGVLDHEQIEAVTVFDRDSRSIERLREAAVPAECLPDERIDVARWSSGGPFLAQVAALSGRLVGEFDRPDPEALAALVRLHVRAGFGSEAELLLAGFSVPLADRALLSDMARAVEGRPVAPAGPLAVAAACPGRHGLWLAIGGAAPVFHDDAHFAGVHAAFAELPPDLREMVAPGLVARLVAAGRPAEARLILETTERPGGARTADLELAEARLQAAEGQPEAAVRGFGALVERNAPNATEALAALVRLAVDSGQPIPEGLVTDLRTVVLQHRRSPNEAELRLLLAEALAYQGALAAAIEEIRLGRRALPEAAGRFDALAPVLLATADPARVGEARYAEVTLAAGDLIGPTPAGDAARRAIATHLAGIGLPEAALAVIAPLTAAGDAGARLIAAEAELRLDRPAAAQATLAGLAGPEAAALRARAHAQAGEFGDALAALDAAGLGDASTPYVWPSGDWARARDDATASPERLAMASYMAARGGAAEAPVPGDATVDPTRAFREPLPGLDRPSLASARRLLDTGREVGGFIQDLLAAP